MLLLHSSEYDNGSKPWANQMLNWNQKVNLSVLARGCSSGLLAMEKEADNRCYGWVLTQARKVI